MCETSNRPSALRTALCSLIVPAGYDTGMWHPPKSMSFAPSRLCASHSGVLFGSIAANTTSRYEDVLASDRRIARATAHLEVRGAARLEAPGFAPAKTAAARHGEIAVANLGVHAPELGAVGILVLRIHHLL